MNSGQMLEQALKQHQAGNLREAERLYRQILQAEPGHVDALHLLGVVAHQVGRHDSAVELITTSLRARPNFAEAHCNLGAALQALGNLDEAVACYRQAVHLKPDYAEAHNNLGNALRLQDKLAEAAAALQMAVRLRPGYAGALTTLGLVLQKLGRLDEAVAHHQQALRHVPNYAEAYSNLGIALQEQGKLDEAAASYQQALRLRPNFAEAHHNLGGLLKRQEKLDEAAASYERALSLKPDYAEAHNNLGTVLHAQEKLDEAAASFQQALRLKPDYSEAHGNLGGILRMQEKPAEAAACYERALRLRPDSAEAHFNLGNVFKDQGKMAEALASYREAVRCKPDHAVFHSNLALHLLLMGEFAQGWSEYEWRWQTEQVQPHLRHFPQPSWQGNPLAASTILLHAEQGLGDSIQFVRFAPLVKERVGKVLCECQPALVRLFQSCAGIDEIIPAGQPLPSFDVHAPLMSLPGILKTTLATLPANIPYLDVSAGVRSAGFSPLRSGLKPALRTSALTEAQARVLSPSNDLKIGVVWQGNPNLLGDAARSFPLALLEPLASVPGVRLISLQIGPGTEQLENLAGRFPIAELGSTCHDFHDMAAVMKNLDLVISIDSSPAHLAGALGVPVWVPLPFICDWRWLLERQDSPWYPTMKLFRQTARGDWSGVFERMIRELRSGIGQ